MKKIIPILVTLLLFSGCSQPSKKSDEIVLPQPTATLAPGIKKPEGRILETIPNSMEGRVVRVDDYSMTLSVAGEEKILKFSDEAKNSRKILEEKHGMAITHGTFLLVEYEKINGTLYANKISFVNSN